MTPNLAPDFLSVTAVEVPTTSAVARTYASTDLADAYSVLLPHGVALRPEQLARIIFLNQSPWIDTLMRIRDAVVARFGLKTAAALTASGASGTVQRIGLFRVYSTNDNEIVMGEDDSHLDFRLSLLCSAEGGTPGQRRLTLSTVVRCHNMLGRAYIFVIAPFHRIIVQASLRRAARTGWVGS